MSEAAVSDASGWPHEPLIRFASHSSELSGFPMAELQTKLKSVFKELGGIGLRTWVVKPDEEIEMPENAKSGELNWKSRVPHQKGLCLCYIPEDDTYPARRYQVKPESGQEVNLCEVHELLGDNSSSGGQTFPAMFSGGTTDPRKTLVRNTDFLGAFLPQVAEQIRQKMSENTQHRHLKSTDLAEILYSLPDGETYRQWGPASLGRTLWKRMVEAGYLHRRTVGSLNLYAFGAEAAQHLDDAYLSLVPRVLTEDDLSTTQPTPPVPASATESREPPESDDDDEIYELMAEMAQKIKTLEEEIERRPTAGDLATLQARNAELEAELANRPSKKDVAREMAMKALGKST